MQTYEERINIVKSFLDENCLPILQSKNLDYTGGSQDANNGFKAIAEMAGVNKYEVWNIFFMKHLFALQTWIKTGDLSSESIDSRITDMVNYLLILVAMKKEDQDQRQRSLTW